MWHKNDGDEQVELPPISLLGFSNTKGEPSKTFTFIVFLGFSNAKGEPSKTFTFIFFSGFPNACNELELTFIFSWDFWMLVMNQ
jgi:hypothetical protein